MIAQSCLRTSLVDDGVAVVLERFTKIVIPPNAESVVDLVWVPVETLGFCEPVPGLIFPEM